MDDGARVAEARRHIPQGSGFSGLVVVEHRLPHGVLEFVQILQSIVVEAMAPAHERGEPHGLRTGNPRDSPHQVHGQMDIMLADEGPHHLIRLKRFYIDLGPEGRRPKGGIGGWRRLSSAPALARDVVSRAGCWLIFAKSTARQGTGVGSEAKLRPAQEVETRRSSCHDRSKDPCLAVLMALAPGDVQAALMQVWVGGRLVRRQENARPCPFAISRLPKRTMMVGFDLIRVTRISRTLSTRGSDK